MSQSSWKEVWWEGPGPTTKKEFIILFIKGTLMGAADLIPGVSGGTVAFITGIYERLLLAISSFNNRKFFGNLLQLKFKDALGPVHLRFIIPVLSGILITIFSLAKLMHYLISSHPIPTWGLFFGLIAASVIVVGRDLKNPFSFKSLFWILIGTIFGYMAVSIIPVSTPSNYWFIFLCGVIGITAMILPGLSGSFLLLILGKYEYITGAVKDPFNLPNLTLLVVFACGTATGLLGFSKFLSYLLSRFRGETMAFLTGLLIGTLKKLWPWKEVVESKIVRGKVRILRESNYFPSSFDIDTSMVFGIMLLGFIAILMMEFYSNNRKLLHE